jgi:hypothetical protein
MRSTYVKFKHEADVRGTAVGPAWVVRPQSREHVPLIRGATGLKEDRTATGWVTREDVKQYAEMIGANLIEV